MYRGKEKNVWEDTVEFEILHGARGRDTKNKGKTMHCKTEGVKAEEICVNNLIYTNFI